MMIYSKALFDKLSPQEQATLRECDSMSRQSQLENDRKQSQESLVRMKAKGMVVNELSPAELERMRAAARPVQEKYIQAIGTEMMTAVQDDLKRQRGR